VVCGTGEGTLNIFSWGEWGDMSDRFPGHPQSVDACVAISNNVVVTGSMDGIIRYGKQLCLFVNSNNNNYIIIKD
jgi:hypothetical protein